MKPKIFFVCCGPGDRKLITVKGEEIIKATDTVFYFPPYEKVFGDILKGKKRYAFFDYTFEEIKKIIEFSNNDIAFLVPGDLSVFSPFSSFLHYFGERIEVIPGIGTYSYFAAKLKKILNPCGKVYGVTITSTRMLSEEIGDFSFKELFHPKTTLVIYMNTLSIKELVKKLLELYNDTTPIYIGFNLAGENEEIFSGTLANIEKSIPYDLTKEKFATIMVGNFEEMPFNKSWWNKKAEEKIRK